MAAGTSRPRPDGLAPDALEPVGRAPERRPAGRQAGLGTEPDGLRSAATTRDVLSARQGRAAAGTAAGTGALAADSAARRGALSADFVQLHYAIEALRSQDRPVVLQFVSSGTGEGTSTVAAGFAAVAASERPGAVLVVSCGRTDADAACAGTAGGEPASMASLIEAVAAGRQAEAAVWRDAACGGLLRARLGRSAHPLMEVGAGALRRLLNGLGERYATVVLDCAPATSPDSAALSRHCDGTVLVVRAGTARVAAVDQARIAVERAGGHVVGVVLNRRRRSLPSWLERLL